MRRALIVLLCYILSIGPAFAVPGSPIGSAGGSGSGSVTEVTGSDGIAVANGTSTPALSLTDNSIDGRKLNENSIRPIRLKTALGGTTGVDNLYVPAYDNSGTGVFKWWSFVGLMNVATPCDNNEILKYNTSTGWYCTTDIGASGTMGSQDADNVLISGGTINGTPIGGSTAAAGTFTTVTASEFLSTAADNTRGTVVPNTAAPTGANLELGKCWFLTSGNAWECRNGDNTVTAKIGQIYKYYRTVIDNPAVTDNVLIDGPIPFAQTWDNVTFIVQDNTGKLSGSAGDNVTVNLAYCTNADNTWAQCTKVFTSDQVPTGSAVSTPALNNTAPPAAGFIRIGIAAANGGQKLYIRVRYRE